MPCSSDIDVDVQSSCDSDGTCRAYIACQSSNVDASRSDGALCNRD